MYEGIKKELEEFPEAEVLVLYNNKALIIDETLCEHRYTGPNLGHKLGCMYATMEALRIFKDSSHKILVFSHDDVTLHNVTKFKEILSLIGAYDFIGRKYKNYAIMLETFVMHRNALEGLDLAMPKKLLLGIRNTPSPEYTFAELLKNVKKPFYYDFEENAFGESVFGYSHYAYSRGEGDGSIDSEYADFWRSYGKSFKKLYQVNSDSLREVWLEDTFQGYPHTPAGSAFDSEMKAMYCAIRLAKPKRVLEIGNWKGFSAQHIMLALENNGGGHLTLVDIKELLTPEMLRNIKAKGYTRVLMDSAQHLKAKHSYDFIVHDGCHEYTHVKTELQLMIRNATTSFDIWSHDYYASVRHGVNVKQAWDEEGPNFNY